MPVQAWGDWQGGGCGPTVLYDVHILYSTAGAPRVTPERRAVAPLANRVEAAVPDVLG